jgi:hypothetical protein
MIPFTIPEVLHLVWALVWQHVTSATHMLRWSLFRRFHQAQAKAAHYHRRLAGSSP